MCLGLMHDTTASEMGRDPFSKKKTQKTMFAGTFMVGLKCNLSPQKLVAWHVTKQQQQQPNNNNNKAEMKDKH